MEVFLLILVIAISVVIILVLRRNADRTKRALSEQIEQLTEEVAALSKYKPIRDVEDEVVAMRERAKAERVGLLAEVATIRERVEAERVVLLAEVKDELKEARERKSAASNKASETILQAQATATQIVDLANSRAKEIAGNALEAKGKSDHYEATVRAMQNAIKGYGDDYLIPNHTAIDDLSDDFDHKEAGQRLQECRRVTRSLVSAGKASDCDYAEKNRRETALRFVLDAFNGKIDAIMTTVKRDNYGTLRQKFLDSFTLVNQNGLAFRNARITDTYLQSRLNELKWAVATEELRQQEREEQREIKARIREEEHARREYEKAQKEALKEERLLEKAMAQAQEAMKSANEAERREWAAKHADLQSKWKEADSRNQRALSMAQQTKRGHVYIISNIGSFGEEVFKIGMTRRLDPMDRVKELGDASVPFNFDVHAMIYSEDAPKLEGELHKNFRYGRLNRVNLRREFFRVSLTELKNLIDRLGIEVHWTMKAEAAQYRESLAIMKEEATSENEENVA